MGDRNQEIIKTHNTVVVVVTVACIGAIVESITQGWEFWVPPLIAIANIVALWMHISQYSTPRFRENYYIIFAMLVTFYHGMHRTSFFDVVVTCALFMGTVAVIRRIIYLRIILVEFFAIMGAQIYMAVRERAIEFDSLTTSRVILHVMVLICIYKVMTTVIEKSLRGDEEIRKRDMEKKAYDHNMEDFLVNISHELRTPVNVINGLSVLILRKEDREDIRSIRNAGRRLAHQIEDIQDYSEIQRKEVVMENERYMITSLLNDLLTGYRSMKRGSKLEFIVDLDPTVPSVLRGDAGKIRKILEHLLDNAFKFTKRGGARLRITALKKEYGVNLIMEVSDTGIGMTEKDIEAVSRGIYQANQNRDRTTGGIGLGLSIVYGIVRGMNGFVKIESEPGRGTTVRVSVFQEVVDQSPCMNVRTDRYLNVVFYNYPGKYKVAALGRFYRDMGKNLAAGLRVNLYMATRIEELKKLISKGGITHVFMGVEEYRDNNAYIDSIAEKDIQVAVYGAKEFTAGNSRIMTMMKPIYGLQVVQLLNGTEDDEDKKLSNVSAKPALEGLKALVVDDEPMNLVVATGLLGDYSVESDTADSGKEAIRKFENNEYDVVFMDHMMPEMDGVEAMKILRNIADQQERDVKIIALTANAVSGAKEMFMREGFDGFIAKPIRINDFERVMNQVMTDGKTGRKRGTR